MGPQINRAMIQILPIAGLPEIQPGDPLPQMLAARCMENDARILPGDVLVVTQKIVSKAEDRFVDLAQMDPLTIGGLDGYYRVEPLFRLSYAKPEQPPKRL